jgi:hypothetical protein
LVLLYFHPALEKKFHFLYICKRKWSRSLHLKLRKSHEKIICDCNEGSYFNFKIALKPIVLDNWRNKIKNFNELYSFWRFE